MVTKAIISELPSTRYVVLEALLLGSAERGCAAAGVVGANRPWGHGRRGVYGEGGFVTCVVLAHPATIGR